MANTFLPPGIPTADHQSIGNPYPYPDYIIENSHPGFDEFSGFLDHLALGDQPMNEYSTSSFTASILHTSLTQEMTSTGSSASASSTDGMPLNGHMQVICKENKKTKMDQEHIVAFRTKTELETLDDGYKWRKYGKKMVKSNPNPRNYYKCSSAGCKVKKRVERDGADSSYLITTYEGVHDHECPCIIYYEDLPFAFSFGYRTLQPSSGTS